MMKLQSFCGCFSLKSGTIVVGAATVIWALSAIIASILAFFCEVKWRFNDHEASFEYATVLTMSIAATIIYTIVIGVTGALMIHGARKRAPGFILLWLGRTTADLLMMCTAYITFLMFGLMLIPIGTYLVCLAAFTLVVAMHAYIWLIVYSFYKELTIEKYSTGFSNEEELPEGPLNVYHRV